MKEKMEINKVYNCDCLDLLKNMPEKFIDLIYIDPPFGIDRDKDFGMLAWKIIDYPRNKADELLPIIPKDIGQRNYLRWIYERLFLMHKVLKDTGSIYVHCDYRINSFLKIILDDIFGSENYRNEIIWCYEDIGSRKTNYFNRKHDYLLFYAKSSNNNYNVLRKGLSQSTIERFEKLFDKDGKITYAVAKEKAPGTFRRFKGVPDNLDEVWIDKNIGGAIPDWWERITPITRGRTQSLDYPTQKPEILLERIISASSNEGNLVADFFCGSGTTLAVAQKLNRNFIGCDINERAYNISRRRIYNQIIDRAFIEESAK
jgi:site-specific DNA-methyltransferase (adenine-specific)/adenine-specific DNA-methyltransferase